MPCYSYTNANPVLFTNVISTQTVSGATYSYSTLALICEFPVDDQLQVFKKNSTTNAEVQLVYTTDFTINTTNETITISASLTGYDQVVIKRVTLSDKMIYRFTDGAKLTAKQLNDCFHQLLFVTQEKGYLTSTVNVNYPVSVAVSAWNSGTTYGVGDIVSFNNKIYKSIVASNTNNTPTNTAFWSVINPQLNSFVITGNQNTVEFDLLNLSLNYTLVWNGSKFVAGPVVSTISSLTDVDISPVSNNDVLIYDTSNGSKWTAKSPSFSIIETNLKFADYTFYTPSRSTSYFNPSNQNIILSGTALTAMSGFKDNSNRWVLTDAPTVYHIIKKTLPSEVDPVTFFSTVRSELDLANQNLTNPVKLKLYWNLNHDRQNLDDASINLSYIASNGSTYKDNLGNFKTAFWHKPEELYNTAGYDINAPSSLLKHGVVNTGITYSSGPYFTYNSNNPVTTFKSKVESYGVKAFYLSVPECRVTSIYLPVVFNNGGTYVFTALSNLDNVSATGLQLGRALQTPGNEFNENTAIDGALPITAGRGIKDYYLMGLRDMAVAGARFRYDGTSINLFGNGSTDLAKNNRGRVSNDIARWNKGKVIGAWYASRATNTSNPEGWRNISYKRFETTETALPVLWKIPDQIIYFNRVALANSLDHLNGTEYLITDDGMGEGTNRSTRDKIRFSGFHRLQSVANGNSSTTSTHDGLYHKANGFWDAWQQRWSDQTSNTFNYKFNEADIEWALGKINAPDNGSVPKIYRNFYDNPQVVTAQSNGSAANIPAAHFYKWPWRANDVKAGTNTSQTEDDFGGIGVHSIIESDWCKLFSEADQFIEDPADEYVYRIVAQSSVLNYLKQTGIKNLKSSIILEHGFSDLSQSDGNSITLTTLESQYDNPRFEPTTKRAWSRLFESKLKVYVKDEKVERANGIDYYVISLVIRVPRLKSIGYSPFYRRFLNNTAAPKHWPAAVDTDPELGPWLDFNSPYTPASVGATIGSYFDLTGTGVNGVQLYRPTNFTTALLLASSQYVAGAWGTVNSPIYNLPTSGRIESAVKFTSLGLPSNLWIRLSVLNTDGTTALLNGTNTNFGFTT